MNRSIAIYLLFPFLLLAEIPQKSAEAVISAFSGLSVSKRHLTPHLLEIAKNGMNLPANDRIALEALGFNFSSSLVSRIGINRPEANGLDKFYDSGFFRFHYTTTGWQHAVPLTDDDASGIPDYIESMANIFNHVAQELHENQGYIRPPGDGYYSGNLDKGGSDHYDIYVRELPSRYYAYTQPEDFAQGKGDNEKSKLIIEMNAFTSYMAMRNNYKNFPLEEMENIKVSAAHEYFHAIQFGYDGWEMPWILEASAVWIEEEIYDEINDCYQYMQDWFEQPDRALDESGFHWYGSFIFFEYIEQHMGGTEPIRIIFEESVKADSRKRDGSHAAVDASLNQQGYSFQHALNGMSVANKIMSSLPVEGNYIYEEAEAYPVEGPAIFRTVNFQTGKQDTVYSTSLDRFASQYIQVITQLPVLIDLINNSGSLSDLQLNAILRKKDDSFMIISSPSINIDPIDLKSIHLSVVSQDTFSGNWDYSLAIQDGKPGITNANVPVEFKIANPYPNPFNGGLKFSVYMMKEAPVSINIIDLRGKQVKRLHNGKLTAGNHNFSWYGKGALGNRVSSGVYYIKVSGQNTQDWRPVTYVK